MQDSIRDGDMLSKAAHLHALHFLGLDETKLTRLDAAGGVGELSLPLQGSFFSSLRSRLAFDLPLICLLALPQHL